MLGFEQKHIRMLFHDSMKGFDSILLTLCYIRLLHSLTVDVLDSVECFRNMMSCHFCIFAGHYIQMFNVVTSIIQPNLD